MSISAPGTPQRGRIAPGGDEGQFGGAVVLGDRDPARECPIADVRGECGAGDHRRAQRRGRRQRARADRPARPEPRAPRWRCSGRSVSSAPIARVCTAANRCRVACSGPVSRTRSSGPSPASSANGAKDAVQESAVRSTGRGRPEVPEVTAIRKVPSGTASRAGVGPAGSASSTGIRCGRAGEDHRQGRGNRLPAGDQQGFAVAAQDGGGALLRAPVPPAAGRTRSRPAGSRAGRSARGAPVRGRPCRRRGRQGRRGRSARRVGQDDTFAVGGEAAAVLAIRPG